ncbi:MAG: hypothetical protein AB7U20_24445 [Planctomycetaceae bacterium]
MSQRLSDGLKGALWGVFLGGFGGLGVCIWLIHEPLLFTGDTIVFGALICGGLGFVFGDDFLEWIKENWWWFS